MLLGPCKCSVAEIAAKLQCIVILQELRGETCVGRNEDILSLLWLHDIPLLSISPEVIVVAHGSAGETSATYAEMLHCFRTRHGVDNGMNGWRPWTQR